MIILTLKMIFFRRIDIQMLWAVCQTGYRVHVHFWLESATTKAAPREQMFFNLALSKQIKAVISVRLWRSNDARTILEKSYSPPYTDCPLNHAAALSVSTHRLLHWLWFDLLTEMGKSSFEAQRKTRSLSGELNTL